ncbi:MAG TPA: anti-sigma factor [Nevskiaceae bacterium]|nr:anti-sigma factor [Nevskiaceae bacterium]
MSASPVPFVDADLHAYADGQMSSERVRDLEAELAKNPELATRVADIRAQSAALRSALDPILSEPIPERLIAAARPPSRRDVMTRLARDYGPLFATAAALVIGIGIGWFGRTIELERQGMPVTFARQAAFTHALYAADVNRPVEVWANEEKRLVTWLTKRLGHQVQAPDLNPLGYSLVGGRLVAGNEKPTALFMYENADRQRLSLQVRWADSHVSDTAFRYAVENGVGVFYWIDDNCSYAISGNVDRAQLLAIARTVYGQLAVLDAAKPAPR